MFVGLAIVLFICWIIKREGIMEMFLNKLYID